MLATVVIQQVKSKSAILLLKSIVVITLVLLTTNINWAQSVQDTLIGKVSFKTSDKFYVKFENTDLISIGDTLLSLSPQGMRPTLVVKKKSSISCVCESLNRSELNIGNEVMHFFQVGGVMRNA